MADFNTLVDDTGDNLSGTFVGKTQLQGLLMGAVVARSDTGAVNNWAPGLAGHTLILWAGASDATISGLGVHAAGQRVTIRNTGTKVSSFLHQSGSSSAANRFTNSVTSGPTPIAPGGWLTYQHDGGSWQLVAHEQGAWIPFTPRIGGGTSESGQVYSTQTGRSHLSGRTVRVQGRLTLSTLGTITGEVRIKGFPYTNGAFIHSLQLAFFGGLTTAVVNLWGYIAASATSAVLQMLTVAATTGGTLAQANLSATTDLVFTASYETT